MPWRLQLTNHAIHSVSIIDGHPALLATWIDPDRVVYHDLMTGAPYGKQICRPPEIEDRHSTGWQSFVGELTTPGGTFLPVVRTQHLTIYTTDDGRMRLYHVGDATLYLDDDGDEIALDSAGATHFIALTLDRCLGFVAALDRDGLLYLYQQHLLLGAFDLNLTVPFDLRPAIAISQGGAVIFVTDGQQIVLTDSSGQTRQVIHPHYPIRLLACSPDGRYLATCDLETGVIRVYHGEVMALGYQRFAIDLVTEAAQIQLMTSLPPLSIAPGALAIDNRGVVAFAMSGVICVSDLLHMDQLPRSQPLL